jgi:hypothetical protein
MNALGSEMRRRYHRAQRRLDRSPRIGEEAGDPRQRLFGLGVENMQNRTDQERVARFLPVVARGSIKTSAMF